jgi:hypothetical protein
MSVKRQARQESALSSVPGKTGTRPSGISENDRLWACAGWTRTHRGLYTEQTGHRALPTMLSKLSADQTYKKITICIPSTPVSRITSSGVPLIPGALTVNAQVCQPDWKLTEKCSVSGTDSTPDEPCKGTLALPLAVFQVPTIAEMKWSQSRKLAIVRIITIKRLTGSGNQEEEMWCISTCIAHTESKKKQYMKPPVLQ